MMMPGMMMGNTAGIGGVGIPSLTGTGMGAQFGHTPGVFGSVPGMSGVGAATPGVNTGGAGGGLGHGTPATNAVEASKNLLVNYLPPQYDESQVSGLFSTIGRVEKVKIIRDQASQQSKGFGFVTMAVPDDALRAIKDMSGKMVAGKKLRVAYAQPHLLPGRVSPSVNVCFTGFGTSLTQQILHQLAAEVGEVQEAKVLDPSQHPRGVGFVRFATVPQAEACVERYNNQTFPLATGESIILQVKYAERKKVKQKAIRASVKAGHFPSGEPSNVVFMHGIGSATDNDVMGILSNVVNTALVTKIDIPKGDQSHVKNYCFVHLNDVRTAQQVLQLNGQVHQGKPLQVRFK